MFAASAGLLLLAPLATASAAGQAYTVGATFEPEEGSCGEGDFTALQSSSGNRFSAVPVDGVITQWQFQAGAQAPRGISLRVGRRSPAPSGFDIVGAAADTAVDAARIGVSSTRLPVRAGDVLGFHVAADGSVGCGREAESTFGYVLADGDVQSGPLPFDEADMGFQLDVAATVEPDADRDGFGDVSQDRCPTQATVQVECPVLPKTPKAAFRTDSLPDTRRTSTPIVGKKLVLVHIAPTDFTPAAATVTVQWRRRGKVIPGATRSSYRPQRSEVGAVLQAWVTVSGPAAPTKVFIVRTNKVKATKRRTGTG